jgi:hypothetical protein
MVIRDPHNHGALPIGRDSNGNLPGVGGVQEGKALGGARGRADEPDLGCRVEVIALQ